MNATQICSTLLSLDWREDRDQFRDYARMFSKRYPTPTRCACNDDRPGMLVFLYVSALNGPSSIEMEVCGGLSDGTWFKLLNYVLPPDVDTVLSMIPRMLTAWEAAASAR